MIRFTKYHGCGNDFIILREVEAAGAKLPALAQEICHRQTGIGADGMILVREKPVLEMLFYNQDGSVAPMCGNGIRCFAGYCRDEGICSADAFEVKTGAGMMTVTVVENDPFTVRIGMGKPSFAPADFGAVWEGETLLSEQLETSFGTMSISGCFMGTTHTALFVDDFQNSLLEGLGKEICEHPMFPQKTNVNFVKILSPRRLALRTYERGAGLTLACGTGACASVVVGARLGKCEREAEIVLPYGALYVALEENGNVTMAGPAAKICEGTYHRGGNNND